MKLNVCDVCLAKDKALVKSRITSGFKGLQRLAVCEKHKDFLRENGYATIRINNPTEVSKYVEFINGILNEALKNSI